MAPVEPKFKKAENRCHSSGIYSSSILEGEGGIILVHNHEWAEEY